MRSLRDLRDDREMEELPRRMDPDEAASALEGILERHPGEPRAAALLARVRSEGGELERALAAAELAGKGISPTAARVLKAEVLLDAGKTPQARELLEAALAAEEENLLARGLLLLLDLESKGLRGARDAIARLSPGPLWSAAVLSRLLLALEAELERRSAGSAPGGLHRARSALFRPRFEEAALPRFWIDRMGDFLARWKGRDALARKRREGDIRRALIAGDLGRAAEHIRSEVEEARKRGRKEELATALLLALEVAFLEERFEEAERLHSEWLEAGGSVSDPYPAALGGYSLLARGKAQRALEVFGSTWKEDEPTAELLHLAAAAELKLENRPRAAGLLRRAADADDVSLVRLAREEAAFLDGLPEG